AERVAVYIGVTWLRPELHPVVVRLAYDQPSRPAVPLSSGAAGAPRGWQGGDTVGAQQRHRLLEVVGAQGHRPAAAAGQHQVVAAGDVHVDVPRALWRVPAAVAVGLPAVVGEVPAEQVTVRGGHGCTAVASRTNWHCSDVGGSNR